jgi:hypothetical protein
VDLPLVEEALVRTPLLAAELTFTVEQNLFAILGGVKPSALLPDTYVVVSNERSAPPSAIMRHYVGQVRDQFYSEGLPTVAESLLREFGSVKKRISGIKAPVSQQTGL